MSVWRTLLASVHIVSRTCTTQLQHDKTATRRRRQRRPSLTGLPYHVPLYTCP
jgi:hypothetical protein